VAARAAATARAEPGELAAAGDDHEADRAGRQQGADLLLVAGVVEHDEELLVGDQGAVHPRLRVRPLRDLVRRHAERVEEPADSLSRRGRGAGGVEAAQVHVQLPVAEPVRDPVRPVQRQGGLAHPGGAADRGDHHRARRARVGVVQHPGQRVQFGGAAGEVGDRGWQLPRRRRGRAVASPVTRVARLVGRPGGQQVFEPIGGDTQRLAELGADPGQRLGFAAFPAHHGRALDVQQAGERLLGKAQRLAALDEPLPPRGSSGPVGYGVLSHGGVPVIRHGLALPVAQPTPPAPPGQGAANSPAAVIVFSLVNYAHASCVQRSRSGAPGLRLLRWTCRSAALGGCTMDSPGASAHPGSTAVTTVGEANPLHEHHAALISIAVAGKPDPVTAAIARHLAESGSVYLELPDGRLALIVDLSGATWLTRRDAQYLRD
jgi:hypothetical protein